MNGLVGVAEADWRLPTERTMPLALNHRHLPGVLIRFKPKTHLNLTS